MKIKIFRLCVCMLLLFSLSACAKAYPAVSRGKAFEVLALCMAGREEIAKSYPGADAANLSAPVYAHYLLQNGIIGEELSQKKMEGFLTFDEMKSIQVVPGESEEMSALYRKNRGSADVGLDKFYTFVLYFQAQKGKSGLVRSRSLSIYQIEEGGENTEKIYASGGNTYLADKRLEWERYIDKEIQVLLADKEILFMEKLVSESVEYKNVFITAVGKDEIEALVLHGKRRFPLKKGLDLSDHTDTLIADLHLEKGKLSSLSIKSTKISGKLLSVEKEFMEIEGYGRLYVSEHFSAFDGESIRREGINRLRVGSTVHEFYIDGSNIIQAAVRIAPYRYDRVRVLIMNDYFKVRHHNTISLQSTAGLTVRKGGEEISVAADSMYSLTKDDLQEDERVFVTSRDGSTPIQVPSLKRDLGIPSYSGSLEIVRRDDNIYLVNDVDTEEYLRKVVPSEMPESFAPEALKAQALVARTYTYRTMSAQGELRVFGAQLDDSVNYQVYGNHPGSEKTDAAVRDTAGESLRYGGAFAETFYYSTSAGVSTDGTIWGAKAEDIPYLQSRSISPERRSLSLKDNTAFKNFIDQADENAYEKNYDFFRWETTTNSEILREKTEEAGNIQSVRVTKRGEGGIVLAIEIRGDKGSHTVKGHNAVRAALGNSDLEIRKNNGESVSGFSSLPSSFFYIEELSRDESGTVSFRIRGGGYGHGVGMSQNAAQEMALSGMDYRQIAAFFYEGATVE